MKLCSYDCRSCMVFHTGCCKLHVSSQQSYRQSWYCNLCKHACSYVRKLGLPRRLLNRGNQYPKAVRDNGLGFCVCNAPQLVPSGPGSELPLVSAPHGIAAAWRCVHMVEGCRIIRLGILARKDLRKLSDIHARNLSLFLGSVQGNGLHCAKM